MKKPNKTSQLLESLGWVGVFFVIASYALLALGVIDSSSFVYHGLVLFGAAFIAIISYKKHVFQPFVLNVLFAILALIAIIRLFLLSL